MKQSVSRPILEDFAVDTISIPDRPDVDRVIVVPYRTIFRNVSAAPGANVTRLVHDLDEPLGFEAFLPARL